MALLRLDRLGIPRFHRQSRHGDRLAAAGLWPVLELQDSPWQARPPGGAETRSPGDPYAPPRKSTMGRSPHSRRTAQARHHHRRDQRHQVHGPAPPASATDLEDVLGQSPENDGVGGFLCRAKDPVPDPVCVSGAGARAPVARPTCSVQRKAASGSDRYLRGRAGSPGPLAQGMLHRDGPETEESSPSPLTPGGPPLEMGREVRATEGRPEEARMDLGAVLQPHSTDEGGEPQGSRTGRPRYPPEGRGKQAY